MSLETAIKPAGSIDRGSVFDRAKEMNGKLPQVNSQCEAIAVVPVYREFKGGRIVNLLEELQAQHVGSRRFEIILVVNNPPSSDSSRLKGLVDNLKFLTHIDEQKKAGHFPNVHVIDCTDGEIPKRHMGLVRGLGQLLAEGRLDRTEKGDQGIIIQLDADVSVDPDFVSKLLEAYKNPSVHSAMIGRIPLPMDFQGDDYYAAYASQYAYAVESVLRKGGNFSGDGPTLSLRSSMHKKHSVRDYMGANISEDSALGSSLAEAGGMYLLAEPRVYKGDRVRPDGFDSGMRDYRPISHVSWPTVEALLVHAFGNTPVLENKFPFSKGQFDSMPQTEFWSMVHTQLEASYPEVARKLQDYLEREEELARRRMDWDDLNPQLRAEGLHLYGFSRLAMGESQMLCLRRPAKLSVMYPTLNLKKSLEW